jgi:hypothetical protein
MEPQQAWMRWGVDGAPAFSRAAGAGDGCQLVAHAAPARTILMRPGLARITDIGAVKSTAGRFGGRWDYLSMT